MSAALPLLAYLALSSASFGFIDRPDPVGLTHLVVALLIALTGCAAGRTVIPPEGDRWGVPVGLGLLAAGDIFGLLVAPPTTPCRDIGRSPLDCLLGKSPNLLPGLPLWVFAGGV